MNLHNIVYPLPKEFANTWSRCAGFLQPCVQKQVVIMNRYTITILSLKLRMLKPRVYK